MRLALCQLRVRGDKQQGLVFHVFYITSVYFYTKLKHVYFCYNTANKILKTDNTANSQFQGTEVLYQMISCIYFQTKKYKRQNRILTPSHCGRFCTETQRPINSSNQSLKKKNVVMNSKGFIESGSKPGILCIL